MAIDVVGAVALAAALRQAGAVPRGLHGRMTPGRIADLVQVVSDPVHQQAGPRDPAEALGHLRRVILVLSFEVREHAGAESARSLGELRASVDVLAAPIFQDTEAVKSRTEAHRAGGVGVVAAEVEEQAVTGDAGAEGSDLAGGGAVGVVAGRVDPDLDAGGFRPDTRRLVSIVPSEIDQQKHALLLPLARLQPVVARASKQHRTQRGLEAEGERPRLLD